MFATLLFGVLDARTGEMRYVTAAHPAAVVIRSDGRADVLEGGNAMVGAFPGLTYDERTVVLGSR